jgi:hypothetical protein
MNNKDDPNDWVKYSNIDEKFVPLLQRRAAASRVFFSVFLIAIGVLLFLGNLGLLPIHSIWQFWPATVIVPGVWLLTNRTCASSTIWGVFLVGFGTLFLLTTLGLLRVRTNDASWPLSLLFMAAGTAALIRVTHPGDGRVFPMNFAQAFQSRRPASQDNVTDFAILGALKRKSEAESFQGGDLMAIFGNIDYDLRRAIIPTGSEFAVLNVMAVFGAIKIRVPETWRVNVTGAGILGNFEDKTVPANAGLQAPTLVITGYSVFGTVEVED